MQHIVYYILPHERYLPRHIYLVELIISTYTYTSYKYKKEVQVNLVQWIYLCKPCQNIQTQHLYAVFIWSCTSLCMQYGKKAMYWGTIRNDLVAIGDGHESVPRHIQYPYQVICINHKKGGLGDDGWDYVCTQNFVEYCTKNFDF